MYDAVPDPYCYPGTTVLRNTPDLRDPGELELFEAISTAQRAEEPLPSGRLSISHYCAIHRHLFQDIYRWAGKYRTVRMSKDQSAFCYPEYIPREMKRLFAELKEKRFLRNLPRGEFIREATHFLSTLNAIHPFREGNGRTQTSFLIVLCEQTDHPLRLEALDPNAFLEAMIASFHGNEAPLQHQLDTLIFE